MRPLLCALLVYLLFLVQAGLPAWAPDLVLLALVVFALHETRLVAALLGMLAGLCLDLTAPLQLGANMLFFTAVGYLVAALRGWFYRGRWSVPLLTLGALAVKWLLLLALGATAAGLLPPVISTILTLLLAPLAGYAMALVFYRRWNPGSTD